jgi:hypothetical protein
LLHIQLRLLHPVLWLLQMLQPSPGKPQLQHEHLLLLLHGIALLSWLGRH